MTNPAVRKFPPTVVMVLPAEAKVRSVLVIVPLTFELGQVFAGGERKAGSHQEDFDGVRD